MLKFLRSYAIIEKNQALRYAIASTLATCLAGLISRFLQLPTPLFFSLILTSACFIYFSYGTKLLSQTLMITIGCLVAYILCPIAILISSHPITCFIFLVITSLFGYFFSTLNTGCMFIAKLNLVFIAFAITGNFAGNTHTVLDSSFTIVLSWMIAIIVNAAIYGVSYLFTSKNLLDDWHKALHSQLKQLAHNNQPERLQQILQELDHYKIAISTYQLEICLLTDQISHALLKYTQLIKQQPIIITTFSEPIRQLFTGLSKGLSSSDHLMIDTAAKHFNKHMLSLEDDGFFKKTPLTIRKSYTECLFLLNKLASNLATYCFQASMPTKRKARSKSIKQAIQTIRQHKIIDNNNRLTIASKIAIRAAIAIPLSYAIAHLFKINNPAWVILSTNLVLLVRKGDTIKKSFDRIFGHCLGALLVLPLGYYVWPQFSSVYFWTPLLTLITAYYFLKNYFIYGIFLMLILVYLYGLSSSTGFMGLPISSYILIRLIAVTVGCFIAMFASLFIFHNVGTTPLMTAHRGLFNTFHNHIQALKYHRGADQAHSLQLYKKLKNQLEQNIGLYKTLSFQPNQYSYHKKTQHMLIQLEIELTENIGSLSRRMIGSENHLKATPLLPHQLNDYLAKTAHIINHISTIISKLAKKERVIISNDIPALVNTLQLRLESAITEAFSLSDCDEISYIELLHYLGIIYAIQRICHTIHHYIAQNVS